MPTDPQAAVSWLSEKETAEERMMTFVGFCFLAIVGYGVYVYVQKKRLEDYVPPHKKYLDPRPGTGGSSGGGSKDD